MNVFIIILMGFAVLGFIDKAIGGKLGLEKEIDAGLATMGTASIYIIGTYCMAVTFIEGNVETISKFAEIFPIDPSILIGCILAPDNGGQPIALGITDDQAMGFFSGTVVAGCLGQFTSFQLPVIFSMLDALTKTKVIKGFICGLAAMPVGLIAGGLIIGIAPLKLLFNISIIALICLILLIGFLKWPVRTEKILMVFGGIIKSACQILFIIVILGVFVPSLNIVPLDTVIDALLLILRMIIIICGGLVLVKIVCKFFAKTLGRIGRFLGVDELSVVGILLSIINTLIIVSKFKDMDDKGIIMNGAVSVSTSYLLGGQMAFVLFVAPPTVFYGFVAAKIAAGLTSIIIVQLFYKRRMINNTNSDHANSNNIHSNDINSNNINNNEEHLYEYEKETSYERF